MYRNATQLQHLSLNHFFLVCVAAGHLPWFQDLSNY